MNTKPEESQAVAETLQLFPTSTAKQNAAQDPNCAPTELAGSEKHRTVGNKIYDWGIYSTFAWAGVAGLSALSAHEANHGKNPNFDWLRSWNKTVETGIHGFLEKGLMKGAPHGNIKGWARGTAMFATLGLGGCAMMIPIKWMEDNRQKNAARIDNFLGTTPPDPKLVEAEVPQTWNSVLKGRLLSWGLSYVAFAAMGPKTTGHVSDWFSDKATRIFMALKPKANAANVKKWADIAAFDATFTVITASATYAFSRMFARRNMHKTEETQMTIDPATPTPLDPVYMAELPADKQEKRFTDLHKPSERALPQKEATHLKTVLKSKELAAESPQLG